MDTTIANKSYSIGHPLVEALAELKLVNAMLYVLPTKWGDFSPYDYATQFISYIDVAINDNHPKKYEVYFQEIAESMETQSPFIAAGTDHNNILSFDSNKDFLLLHAHTSKLYSLLVKARNQLEIESRELSINMISILEFISSKMPIFIKWLWQFVKMYSSNDEGKLVSKAKIVLWDEQKIKELNT